MVGTPNYRELPWRGYPLSVATLSPLRSPSALTIRTRLVEAVASRNSVSDLLPGLVPLAVGGSIAPPILLLTILLLGSSRPLPNATALALGYFTTCAAIGIAGLTLFGGAGEAVSTVGRVLGASIGALLLLFGVRTLLRAPDPDVQQPRWTKSVSSMSPARAFGLGTALFPIQIKNLPIFVACIDLIAVGSLNPQGNVVALGIVLLIFAVPILDLIGLYAPCPSGPRESSAPCEPGWTRTIARSRPFFASYSELSSF